MIFHVAGFDYSSWCFFRALPYALLILLPILLDMLLLVIRVPVRMRTVHALWLASPVFQFNSRLHTLVYTFPWSLLCALPTWKKTQITQLWRGASLRSHKWFV